MAQFAVNERVKITAQNNQYRGLLGTVKSVKGTSPETYGARPDGHADDAEILFKETDLNTSTIANPLDYGDPAPPE